MRFKDRYQAYNAEVEMCALFATRNSLKFTRDEKGVFTHSQNSCHNAKVGVAQQAGRR
jgi:hypothetical protein